MRRRIVELLPLPSARIDHEHARERSELDAMARSPRIYRSLRSFRAGVAGGISFLKRCVGWGRCRWSGFESLVAHAWNSVIAANLLILARHRLDG